MTVDMKFEVEWARADGRAFASASSPVTIGPHKTALLKTNVVAGVPHGWSLCMRPWPGLAARGLQVSCRPRMGRRGEISAIVENISDRPRTVDAGEPVGQVLAMRLKCLRNGLNGA